MTRKRNTAGRRGNPDDRQAPSEAPKTRAQPLSDRLGRRLFGACAALAFLIVLLGMVWAVRNGSLLGNANAPTASAAFADNATCTDCHQAEARAWSTSHHAKAMARPTPQNVLGDFGDATFEHKGVVSRFFMKGGKYFVRTQGADGKLADFDIAYTIGVDPLQQYPGDIRDRYGLGNSRPSSALRARVAARSAKSATTRTGRCVA